MPLSLGLFPQFVSSFRVITHLLVLAAIVFYQFFYFLFTGFDVTVPGYSICAIILLVDAGYFLFFPQIGYKKGIFPLLFFLDSLLLFALTWILGQFAIAPALLLAFFQLLYVGLFGGWFFIGLYGLWLSFLMSLALLLKGELTVASSALTNISLCFGVGLSAFLAWCFQDWLKEFKLLEERQRHQGKVRGLGHRPEPHFELALQLARKLKPALKAVIQHTTSENTKKLTGFHQFIDQFIEFAEPVPPEESAFKLISDFNGCLKGFVDKMELHPLRPKQLEQTFGLKAKGTVKGHLPDLEKAIANVVLNAFQALKTKSRPRLFINTYDFNRWLVLEIIDNGHGMEPEEVKQAFEPLFSRRFNFSGVGGLGLSLTQKIIRAHGGSVELTSVSGKKTRVRIRLPLIPLDQLKPEDCLKAKKKSA